MKENYLVKLRNIGIMAHIDAGKTTTTERILFHSGKITKIGETHKGESQMDWMDQEQERGITITSTATKVKWKDCEINIIDTPGHVDFTIEVERSLRVLDGAVAILDAQVGVESQTETVWRQANRYNVPRIVFLNKMDKIGADYKLATESISERLGSEACLTQIPIGAEDNFVGLIDLFDKKAYYYDGKQDENIEIKPIPEDLLETVEKARHKMIEQIAHHDNTLLDSYLEGKELSIDNLKKALRKATINCELFPVFVGAAFKNKGVKLLLDAVVDYLPSPCDLPALRAEDLDGKELIREMSDKEPFAGLIFKLVSDPYIGKLTFLRVYSGILHSGSYVLNANKNNKERVGRLVQMHANQRSEVTQARAGDIVAIVGLKKTITGETISDLKNPIILERMKFPEPVISLSLEPSTKADQEKMSKSLRALAEEDPTFRTKIDHETNQTIISGMGELHLDVLVERLKREFNVNVKVGQPKVSYRETIDKLVEVEGKFIRQTGGRGQYGHVWIKFEPHEDKNFEFINKIAGGTIPKEYINPIKFSIKDNLERGVAAGYPMVNIKATLYDGSFHDVDSSEFAFKAAAAIALRAIKEQTKIIILEPIMDVEITTPIDYYGDVIANLTSRRGKVHETKRLKNIEIIKAEVPLEEMFGYSTTLRSLTQGRANYTRQFKSYEKAPKNIAEKVISESNFLPREL